MKLYLIMKTWKVLQIVDEEISKSDLLHCSIFSPRCLHSLSVVILERAIVRLNFQQVCYCQMSSLPNGKMRTWPSDKSYWLPLMIQFRVARRNTWQASSVDSFSSWNWVTLSDTQKRSPAYARYIAINKWSSNYLQGKWYTGCVLMYIMQDSEVKNDVDKKMWELHSSATWKTF